MYREDEQEDEILVEQYITLQFVRDLNLPIHGAKANRDRIFSLPYPEIPLLIGRKRAIATREFTQRRLKELMEQLELLTGKKVRGIYVEYK